MRLFSYLLMCIPLCQIYASERRFRFYLRYGSANYFEENGEYITDVYENPHTSNSDGYHGLLVRLTSGAFEGRGAFAGVSVTPAHNVSEVLFTKRVAVLFDNTTGSFTCVLSNNVLFDEVSQSMLTSYNNTVNDLAYYGGLCTLKDHVHSKASLACDIMVAGPSYIACKHNKDKQVTVWGNQVPGYEMTIDRTDSGGVKSVYASGGGLLFIHLYDSTLEIYTPYTSDGEPQIISDVDEIQVSHSFFIVKNKNENKVQAFAFDASLHFSLNIEEPVASWHEGLDIGLKSISSSSTIGLALLDNGVALPFGDLSNGSQSLRLLDVESIWTGESSVCSYAYHSNHSISILCAASYFEDEDSFTPIQYTDELSRDRFVPGSYHACGPGVDVWLEERPDSQKLTVKLFSVSPGFSHDQNIEWRNKVANKTSLNRLSVGNIFKLKDNCLLIDSDNGLIQPLLSVSESSSFFEESSFTDIDYIERTYSSGYLYYPFITSKQTEVPTSSPTSVPTLIETIGITSISKNIYSLYVANQTTLVQSFNSAVEYVSVFICFLTTVTVIVYNHIAR